MRAQFLLSEIGIGLRRNLTMTISVIVTTAVSLFFVGVALLLSQQVETMKDYWYERVEVSVFLCGADSDVPSCAEGEVTEAQRAQILTDLQSLPQVDEVFYESKEEAYDRFRDQFEDSAFADTITAEAMPESYRVKLVDPEQYEIVESVFVGRPGIEQVQDQKRLLDRFFTVLNGFQIAALAVAVVMLVVAVIMIGTTIQLAAFSRRRETGIMRLVGASSFYIQLPFILEGAIAGFIGAALASGGLIAIEQFIVLDRLVPSFTFTQFIGWDAVWTTLPLLFLLGIALSALASFVTLLRYLRV